MPTGKVKWFNKIQKYGFIAQDDGADVFIHMSALEKAGLSELKDNQRVSFDISDNKGRIIAENIKLLWD